MNTSKISLRNVALGIVCSCCIALIRLIESVSDRIFIYLDIASFGAQFPHLVRLNELGFLMGRGATFKRAITVLFSGVQAAPYLTADFTQALKEARVPMMVVKSNSVLYRLLVPLLRVRNRLLLSSSLDTLLPKMFGREQNRISELALKVSSRNVYSPWLWPRDNDAKDFFRSLNIGTLDDYVVVGYRTKTFKVEQARASGNRRILDIESTQAFRNTSTSDMALAVEAIMDSRLRVIWMGAFDPYFFQNKHIRQICQSIGFVDLKVASMARLQGFIFKHARGAFFGGVSGMCEIPWAMGIPVAVVNWVPYTALCAPRNVSLRTINPWLTRNGDVRFPAALDSTFVTVKRIVRKDAGVLLTLREGMKESLFSGDLYASRNLAVIDNTQAEVVNAAIEFSQYLLTSSRMHDYFYEDVQLKWRRILSENLGQRRVGQAGRSLVFRGLDQTIARMDSLCFATISPSFVANHKDLLD